MDLDNSKLNVNTTSRQSFFFLMFLLAMIVLMNLPQLQMGFDKQIVEQQEEKGGALVKWFSGSLLYIPSRRKQKYSHSRTVADALALHRPSARRISWQLQLVAQRL